MGIFYYFKKLIKNGRSEKNEAPYSPPPPPLSQSLDMGQECADTTTSDLDHILKCNELKIHTKKCV